MSEISKPSVIGEPNKWAWVVIFAQPISFIIIIFFYWIFLGVHNTDFSETITAAMLITAMIFLLIWICSYAIGIIYLFKNFHRRDSIWYALLLLAILGLIPLCIFGITLLAIITTSIL